MYIKVWYIVFTYIYRNYIKNYMYIHIIDIMHYTKNIKPIYSMQFAWYTVHIIEHCCTALLLFSAFYFKIHMNVVYISTRNIYIYIYIIYIYMYMQYYTAYNIHYICDVYTYIYTVYNVYDIWHTYIYTHIYIYIYTPYYDKCIQYI